MACAERGAGPGTARVTHAVWFHSQVVPRVWPAAAPPKSTKQPRRLSKTKPDSTAALSAAAQNWALRQNTRAEQVLWTIAGLLLVFPSLLEAMAETITGWDVPHPAPLGILIGILLLLKQKYVPLSPVSETRR